jgi:hypothetical protein
VRGDLVPLGLCADDRKLVFFSSPNKGFPCVKLSRRLGGSVNWDSLGIEHHQPDGSPIAGMSDAELTARVIYSPEALAFLDQGITDPSEIAVRLAETHVKGVQDDELLR